MKALGYNKAVCETKWGNACTQWNNILFKLSLYHSRGALSRLNRD
jgi:hypothetical protein